MRSNRFNYLAVRRAGYFAVPSPFLLCQPISVLGLGFGHLMTNGTAHHSACGGTQGTATQHGTRCTANHSAGSSTSLLLGHTCTRSQKRNQCQSGHRQKPSICQLHGEFLQEFSRTTASRRVRIAQPRMKFHCWCCAWVRLYGGAQTPYCTVRTLPPTPLPTRAGKVFGVDFMVRVQR